MDFSILKDLKTNKKKNKLFALWISDDNKLPELQYTSIKIENYFHKTMLAILKRL
ncbi:MAG: hypothetical protein LBM96_04470 [Methanobrevibacter sp.]|jgi:hypothetical protein|nr:hypothetical protein [Candidatus Methanoflexus mossambicus]